MRELGEKQPNTITLTRIIFFYLMKPNVKLKRSSVFSSTFIRSVSVVHLCFFFAHSFIFHPWMCPYFTQFVSSLWLNYARNTIPVNFEWTCTFYLLTKLGKQTIILLLVWYFHSVFLQIFFVRFVSSIWFLEWAIWAWRFSDFDYCHLWNVKFNWILVYCVSLSVVRIASSVHFPYEFIDLEW